MDKTAGDRWRTEAGFTTVELVIIAGLVVVVAVVAFEIWKHSQEGQHGDNTPAQSGQGTFGVPPGADIPSGVSVPSGFTLQAHCYQGLPAFDGYNVAFDDWLPIFEVLPSPSPSGNQSGVECQKVWEVKLIRSGGKSGVRPRITLGRLACPCPSPADTLLNLEWKDFERKPYPNGEQATYYKVRFKLTEPATKREVVTWTEWVRVPGGHSHYGDIGSTLIDLSKCATGTALIECAKQQSHQGFAEPPGTS